MKAIAIVELPDDAFDDEAWGDGQWMIDDEGTIRYKEDDAWMHYKDIDGIELRPLPEKKELIEIDEKWCDEAKELAEVSNICKSGWNDCLEDITGETE